MINIDVIITVITTNVIMDEMVKIDIWKLTIIFSDEGKHDSNSLLPFFPEFFP
jgi:hypothetical protein